jgi:hypothetical protein
MQRAPLVDLWPRWRADLASAPRMGLVARPPLLPHLRAVDDVQVRDAVASLAMDGHPTTHPQVLGALALHAARVAAAGWPAPLPRTAAPDVVIEAPLAAYAEALSLVRLTILDLLQGAEPVSSLAAAYPGWRRLLCGGEGAAAADMAVMWDLAGSEPTWDLRAALLHLAVWRLEEPLPGAGLLARLTMNTVRAAAGHPWIPAPLGARAAYAQAVEAALASGDAKPWGTLLAAA